VTNPSIVEPHIMTPNLCMEKILGILFSQAVGLNRWFGVYQVLAATAAGGPLARIRQRNAIRITTKVSGIPLGEITLRFE